LPRKPQKRQRQQGRARPANANAEKLSRSEVEKLLAVQAGAEELEARAKSYYGYWLSKRAMELIFPAKKAREKRKVE